MGNHQVVQLTRFGLVNKGLTPALYNDS